MPDQPSSEAPDTQDGADVIRLPVSLGTSAVEQVVADLSRRQLSPVQIDASGVEFFGALCLQALVSAKRSWNSENIQFEFVNPSEGFLDGMSLLGVEHAVLLEV